MLTNALKTTCIAFYYIRWEQSIDIEYRFIGNLLNESENEVKKENIA